MKTCGGGCIKPGWGGGGVKPVDPDWPRETDNGCDGWPGIEGFGG